MLKNIGLGCLIVLLIFFVFGLSCTRACFRPRRYYRGEMVRPVRPLELNRTQQAFTREMRPRMIVSRQDAA